MAAECLNECSGECFESHQDSKVCGTRHSTQLKNLVITWWATILVIVGMTSSKMLTFSSLFQATLWKLSGFQVYGYLTHSTKLAIFSPKDKWGIK